MPESRLDVGADPLRGDNFAGRPVRVSHSTEIPRLVARRLLSAIVVLWGVTFLTFVLVNAIPGSAAQAILGGDATPQQAREFAVQLGTNRPFFVQYWDWLHGILTGRLGLSLASGTSAAGIIGQRLPVTAELALYAFALALAFSIPVAVLAARKRRGILDRLSMTVCMAGLSIPSYVLGLVLIIVFAIYVPIMPAIGFVPLSQGFGQNIRSLTLPAVAIAIPIFSLYTRFLRADLLEVMEGQEYIVAAKAKGVAPWLVLIRHAFRNSMLGFLTIVGLNLSTLFGSTVIMEVIFGIPGIGQQLYQSIDAHDVVMVEAIVLILSAFTVFTNLVVDVLYAVVDPRIRYGKPSA